MAHFRGQIRGPHWGAKRDNVLIDFWKRHECLFNSSLESFYDRDMKTKLWSECALLIGKSVSDVVRRSRSLRTQYGRVLWHPERVITFQQRMLREKLDFLRPYIVRRRGDSYPEDKSDDHEDDEGEIETEGSNDHETGTSTFGSALDDDDAGQDPNEEFPSEASTSNPSSYGAKIQPPLAETMSLNFEPHDDKGSPDVPDQLTANLSNQDVLNQFVNVMLADMRQIKDNMVLIRLRRDITDLVFKAVEEDMQRRNPVPFTQPGETAQLPSSSRPQTCMQRVLKRKNWGPVKNMRRFCRIQAGQALEEMNGNIPQAMIQASEIKLEIDPHMVKAEDETLT
ncbi:uncharacterized protein LOC109528953 isoform X1 [Hippocampus comes]|uniref:uncharacterized protein LOC109528953 isoform X1 n=2 Tax=Hippocampus comes TaxID=109280 RepID=UPI00094E6A42|nr:PREDICTED: uncharacterized protein LOC109528953 isoform X1 [Hippocampus comes]